jgi:hypothetical protein
MQNIAVGIFWFTILIFASGFKRMPESQDIKDINKDLKGRSPSLAAEGNDIYMAFPSGDSIFYSCSLDNGKHFSAPEFVTSLQDLMVGGGRGPQIISSKGQLLIAAPSASGNIYTYMKMKAGSKWTEGSRINDIADKAKEGFVSLCSNGDGALFATWLDIRLNARNNIFGAGSSDGGRTWHKSQLIYESPDGSVCECCKPAVAMKGKQVVVMFRNNLGGNRDLYVIQSGDRGVTFDHARKLGEGSWKLNGCPMDGGGLVINDDNTVRTVWRREGNIYENEPGKKEELITKGSQCTITGTTGKYYVAFINAGKVYCIVPDGKTVELGQGGSYPRLISIDKSTVLCAWEDGNRIYRTMLSGEKEIPVTQMH